MVSSALAETETRYGISPMAEVLGEGGAVQLFSHCYVSQPNLRELLRVAIGPHRYPERALALAGASAVVLVKDPIDPEYVSFLAGLGPVPEPDRIVATDPSQAYSNDTPLARQAVSEPKVIEQIALLLGDREEVWLNCYMFTGAEAGLARILESVLGRRVRTTGGHAKAVSEANQKHLVRAKALELGVPVAPGEVVEISTGEDGRPRDLSPIERAIRAWLPMTGRVILRGSLGASGSSTFVAGRDPETLREALAQIGARTDNSIYLVEAMLATTVSPNIGLFISPVDGRISFVSVTDQILISEVTYNGNAFPSEARTIDRMLASARTLAEWLRDRGMTGYVGFDFCEHEPEPGGEPDFFLTEINPRVNGATYATALMQKVNMGLRESGSGTVEAFFTRFVNTAARSFGQLRGIWRGRFLDPNTGRGFVPYNTGCLAYGRCLLAAFGQSLDEVRALASEAIP
jgi:hypothetical protein